MVTEIVILGAMLARTVTGMVTSVVKIWLDGTPLFVVITFRQITLTSLLATRLALRPLASVFRMAFIMRGDPSTRTYEHFVRDVVN